LAFHFLATFVATFVENFESQSLLKFYFLAIFVASFVGHLVATVFVGLLSHCSKEAQGYS